MKSLNVVSRLVRHTRLVGLLVLITAATGCRDGYLVDASSPRHEGEGGLAFVLMVCMIVTFVVLMFWLDRVRSRRMDADSDE